MPSPSGKMITSYQQFTTVSHEKKMIFYHYALKNDLLSTTGDYIYIKANENPFPPPSSVLDTGSAPPFTAGPDSIFTLHLTMTATSRDGGQLVMEFFPQIQRKVGAKDFWFHESSGFACFCPQNLELMIVVRAIQS